MNAITVRIKSHKFEKEQGGVYGRPGREENEMLYYNIKFSKEEDKDRKEKERILDIHWC